MKRRLKGAGILFSLAAMIVLLAGSVKADVIVEPTDDFFQRHRSECVYEDRTYVAGGPEEALKVYKSPIQNKVVGTIEKGEMVHLYYIYTYDDNSWGYLEYYKDLKWVEGWVPMAYVTELYDSVSFWNDYRDRIVSESGSLSEELMDSKLYFWNYPGGEIVGKATIEEYTPGYGAVFTDEEGRQWGEIHYYFGWSDVWICLDAPGATEGELFPDGKPVRDPSLLETPEETTSAAEVIRPDTSSQAGLLGAVLLAVFAVMGGSALLLFNIRK